MFTATVILGSIKPKDPDVSAKLSIFKLPSEFYYFLFGNWFIGLWNRSTASISRNQ